MTKLRINGHDLDEIVGWERNLKDDFVDFITTSGKKAVLEGTAPAPGPDPAPDPDPEVPDNVVFAYPIRQWPWEREARISVPKGKTVSSKFTTTDKDEQGGIYFQYENGSGVRYDYWISEVPDGPKLGKYAGKEGQSSISGLINWRQGAGFHWYQELEKGKTYYINIKHTDPEQGETTVLRKVQ